MTTRLDGFGISIALPDTWDGRIVNRGTKAAATDRTTGTGTGTGPEYRDTAGGRTNPVVHLGNFALPPNRGDYGSGAVDIMGPTHAFMVLTEFGPESVGTALFAPKGLPRSLDSRVFSPNALQRRLPNQLGWQHFFTDAGRAFSVFIVLGGARNAPSLCQACSQVLSSTRIQSR